MENWGWVAVDRSVQAGRKSAVTGTRTRAHLLLATLVASSLDARLPLLLVVVPGKVVVTIRTARAAANHANGAPLALCSAIGTTEAGGVGQAVAPDGDRACRAHGRGRTSIAMAMAVLSLGLGCRACGAGSGGCRAVHALTARWRRRAAGEMGKRGGGRGGQRAEGSVPLVSATAAQRSTAQHRRDLPTVQARWRTDLGGAGVAMVLSLGSVGEPAWVMSETVEVEVRGPVAEGAGLGWFKKEAFCSTEGNFCRVIIINQCQTTCAY